MCKYNTMWWFILVNDGKGLPEFDGEADCTYFFSWETKYACPKKREDLCHVESKKKHYNLFDLIRTAGKYPVRNLYSQPVLRRM